MYKKATSFCVLFFLLYAVGLLLFFPSVYKAESAAAQSVKATITPTTAVIPTSSWHVGSVRRLKTATVEIIKSKRYVTLPDELTACDIDMVLWQECYYQSERLNLIVATAVDHLIGLVPGDMFCFTMSATPACYPVVKVDKIKANGSFKSVQSLKFKEAGYIVVFGGYGPNRLRVFLQAE